MNPAREQHAATMRDRAIAKRQARMDAAAERRWDREIRQGVMPAPAPPEAPRCYVGTIRIGSFRTWTARMGNGFNPNTIPSWWSE